MKTGEVKNKKERLVDAAYELVNEKGFEAVSVREIAEYAGVTTGSVYHYFKSKEEIFLDRARKHDSEIENMMLNQLKTMPVKYKILQFFVEILGGYVVSDGVIMGKIRYQSMTKFSPEDTKLFQTLVLLIKEGQEKEEISYKKDASEICRYLLTVFRGTVYDWLSKEGEYDIKAKIEEYMNYALEFWVLK
jgi:AcrR family transcriptional regulator